MLAYLTQPNQFLEAKIINFRNDLTEEEYGSMKEETLDQIKEFTATLDRLNKGDVTLNSKISSMRDVCDFDNESYWHLHMIAMCFFSGDTKSDCKLIQYHRNDPNSRRSKSK